jgi:hypothetical protein
VAKNTSTKECWIADNNRTTAFGIFDEMSKIACSPERLAM